MKKNAHRQIATKLNVEVFRFSHKVFYGHDGKDNCIRKE